MALLHLTKQNFERDVLKSQAPVIVDFWASWCRPCAVIGPIFEELASEYEGRLKFGKLNVDEEATIAQKYGVMSIPTMIVFKGGKETGRMVGAMPKQEFKKKIDAAL